MCGATNANMSGADIDANTIPIVGADGNHAVRASAFEWLTGEKVDSPEVVARRDDEAQAFMRVKLDSADIKRFHQRKAEGRGH